MKEPLKFFSESFAYWVGRALFVWNGGADDADAIIGENLKNFFSTLKELFIFLPHWYLNFCHVKVLIGSEP